jgi:hypothetical protein
MPPAFSGPSINARHFGKTKYPFFCKRNHRLVEGSKSPRRFDIAPVLPKAAARAARRPAMVKAPCAESARGSGACPAPASVAPSACGMPDRKFPVSTDEYPVRT